MFLTPGVWIRHPAHLPRHYHHPQGWDGNDAKYLDWLISQSKCNHCFGKDSEVLHAALRLNRPVKIEGPYCDTLILALNSLNQKRSVLPFDWTTLNTKTEPDFFSIRFFCFNFFKWRVFSAPFALINSQNLLVNTLY